jgi:CDGSH-type Zn-finger protein
VFRGGVEGAWIFPDSLSAEAVVRTALACPSGAIGFERHDGGAQESAPPVNIARLRENGPIEIRADLRLNGEAIGYRATLCRCGASKNKPFCDGSHVGAGFTASGEPATRATEALEAQDGALAVTPQKDGPLQVEGNLEICTGTGRVIEKTTKTWLCRCGASNNKPFCDGSHRGVGFEAP